MAHLRGDRKLKDAIEKQDERKVRHLLENGIDPNAVFHDDDVAPIHLGPGINKSITHLLLEYGGDPNLRTEEGVTPLHIAATWGNSDTLKLLLKHGADLTVKDQDGNTPLDMAEKYDHGDCVRILLRYSHKLKSASGVHHRKLKRSCSLYEKPKATSSSHTSRKSYETSNISQYVTADSDPEEYESLEMPKNKPQPSILKRTQSHHVYSSRDRESKDLRKSTSTESCKEKYLPRNTRHHTSNQPVPLPRRHSGNYTNPADNLKDMDYITQRKSEITSKVAPRAAPKASSPIRRRHRPSRRYHSDDSPNVSSLEQIPSSDDDDFVSSTNTTTDSDLYITVNETPPKPVFQPINTVHSQTSIELQKKLEKLESLKVPISQKIEQLRNCLNKLENNEMPASLERILQESLMNESKPVCDPMIREPTLRESYPPRLSRNSLVKDPQRVARAHSAHSTHRKPISNNVDIKLSMDIPSGKIYVNDKNIKKSKQNGRHTYEIHLDSSGSTDHSSGKSKDDSIIDIKVKPKKKSQKKVYVVNPPNGTEIEPKQEKFVYLDCEDKPPSRLLPSEAAFDRRFRRIAENNNRNHPAAAATTTTATTIYSNHSSSQNQQQNGWRREEFTNDVCNRVIAGTSNCGHHNRPGNNNEEEEKISYKARQRPGLSRIKENDQPSPPHLYPRLSPLTDTVDGPLTHQSGSYLAREPPKRRQQQHHHQQQHHQQQHHRQQQHHSQPDVCSANDETHYESAVNEETVLKEVYQPPARVARGVQESRRLNSQVVHAEIHPERKPYQNKSLKENKNFRYGGRVVEKLGPRDTAAKPTVPMVMNTPRKPGCELYETEKLVRNNAVRRTGSEVSSATTDTYVTCRGLDSEDGEQFFSCDDGTIQKNPEAGLENNYESALMSFSHSLQKDLLQSHMEDSSRYQDLRFDSNELSMVMSEMNLKDCNESSVAPDGAYLSMLSQIEDQIISDPEQSCREPNSVYTSFVEKAESPEQSVMSRLKARDSVSPELNCYDPKESKYNSALLPRESDEDSLYLVCNPNHSKITERQSRDSSDRNRGQLKALGPPAPPPPPKPLSRQKYSENEPDNIKTSHSMQFSNVMGELQGKFQQNPGAQPSKPFYRWQPPANILESKPRMKYTPNKATGLGRSAVISSGRQESLKRHVGLELKNHPLIKKLNSVEGMEPSSTYVENSCHFYTCEISSDVTQTESSYVPSRVERITSQSHMMAVEGNKRLKCKANGKQEMPVESHSCYASIQEDGLDYSRYVSLLGETAVSSDSRYLSIQGQPIDSCDTPEEEGDQPLTSQIPYLSAKEETETPSSNSYSILTQNQNNSQSHFISAQEDGLGISKVSCLSQRRKRLAQNGHSGHELQEPNAQSQLVTLQTRFTASQDRYADQSHYQSFQDRGESLDDQYSSAEQNSSGFKTEDSSPSTKDNSEYQSGLDKSAVNSQWQFVSAASNGIQNRSVTWQNPISTYDETDARLIPSTDDSLSWSPVKDGHSPKIAPLTSTSASEDITSGSTSSDGLKKCLATKEFLSPQKRTTMWVNGLYKIEEYFDQNISSINPVITSQSSSSDNVNNARKLVAANNRLQPSAPPKSEVFNEFMTPSSDIHANTDISIVAVAGTPGEKSDPLTPSSRSPQRSALYPCLHDPIPASSPASEGKEPMITNRLTSETSSVHVSTDERRIDNYESPGNYNNNINNNNNLNNNNSNIDNINDNDLVGFLGNKTSMCAINVLTSVSSTVLESKLPNNKLEQGNFKAKTISTQTPILRIPPSPPIKRADSFLPKRQNQPQPKKSSKITVTTYNNSSKSSKPLEKLQKTLTNLRKLFRGGKSQRKNGGNNNFISVDKSPKFFSTNPSRTNTRLGTSGTQTEPHIYYEPTLPSAQITKSDEISLSVNFSEHLSDYSEKYPGSILGNIKRPTLSENLDISSSSGATSGSAKRLTPPQEIAVGFDEVDCMPAALKANKNTTTTKCGETYRSCIKLPTSNDKAVKYIHTDPERFLNFIERQLSVEAESYILDDSDSAEKCLTKPQEKEGCDDGLFWKSFNKFKTDNPLSDSELAKLQNILKDQPSFTDDGLKEIYIEFGLPTPGPITPTTRRLYINRLKGIANGNIPSKSLPIPDYPINLRRAIRDLPQWEEAAEMEQKMMEKFESPKFVQKHRGRNSKQFFTYLLLDPRVTNNLPLRATKVDDQFKLFRTFVQAVFYVGKGTRDRPYSHLYEAMKRLNRKETKKDEKLSHINDIWNDKLGVISLHCFQGVISEEALSREACIIDAIGPSNLTNKMRGSCYGLTTKWSLAWKREMGTYWLYKAFQIFLAEGERQIFPVDLDYRI
ncbi:uncharacterized protein LOC115220343 isoform X1 [Argonauta hians]